MIDLRLGDCLEVLRGLESESIDAVITDPPYGIGFRYDSGVEIAKTPETYWKWLEPIHRESERVLKPGGLSVWWQAQLNFRHFWDWFGDDIHIYAACKNFVQLRKTAINYAYDPVVMKYKFGEPLRPKKPSRNVDFSVANTAAVVSDPNRPERAHPCPRPLDQVVAVVENFSLPGGTVLDLFMGSGTTGVACVRTGRSFIGCEIDPRYFAIAQERIAAEQAKTPLFA
jgi:site-specific DNA-methyltransferase (adenine-specific)